MKGTHQGLENKHPLANSLSTCHLYMHVMIVVVQKRLINDDIPFVGMPSLVPFPNLNTNYISSQWETAVCA